MRHVRLLHGRRPHHPVRQARQRGLATSSNVALPIHERYGSSAWADCPGCLPSAPNGYSSVADTSKPQAFRAHSAGSVRECRRWRPDVTSTMNCASTRVWLAGSSCPEMSARLQVQVRPSRWIKRPGISSAVACPASSASRRLLPVAHSSPALLAKCGSARAPHSKCPWLSLNPGATINSVAGRSPAGRNLLAEC